MSKLEFSRRNNKKYNTISITIKKGVLELKKNYKILKIDKTKWGYKKAVIELDDPDLLERIKQWETQINDYLKRGRVGGPVTFLYGNKIYPKTLLNNKKTNNYIKLESIWVNNKNKPVLQYWLI